jgi:hypothetical protein
MSDRFRGRVRTACRAVRASLGGRREQLTLAVGLGQDVAPPGIAFTARWIAVPGGFWVDPRPSRW